MPMKGKRYASIDAIQKEVTVVPENIPKKDFARAFERLYKRSRTCITLNGDYLEVWKR